ncbi:CGGC domain-containing protein [bacterium]|nr:CGGC domain-containing protein [bacterium]
MEKVVIIGCKRVMDDVCVACSRCMVGFNRKAGEFERYSESGAELIGMLGCGDCPGAGIVPRLVAMKTWNLPMNEQPTKIHIAPCIADHCPYKESIMAKIKAKAGIEVIVGAHPYIPESIFS